MNKRARFLDYINHLSISEFDRFLLDLQEMVEMFDDPEEYPNAMLELRRVYKILVKE